MARPARSEVWMVDLGMAAKVRPALVLTAPPADDELDLVTILLHTTALRGNACEVVVMKSFLKPGAFHIQQVQSVPRARFIRRLGALNEREWAGISVRLAAHLGIATES